MYSTSLSPRGLAATALAGLALLLLPASAIAQVEPAPVGDAPQSSSVMGSGRPDVDLGFSRTQGAKPKLHVRRTRRGKARAAVFGKAKPIRAGRILIRI